jgi:hypothetical protein
MAKPGKKRATSSIEAPSPKPASAQPPAKHPVLLTISIVLFVLWFAFLLATALSH